MLTKALLTGGLLSLLAGSIVYFGTEGAVATERDNVVSVEFDDIDLAGDETEVRQSSDARSTSTEEETDPPKTKWLDQYLKSNEAPTQQKAEHKTNMKPEKLAPAPEVIEDPRVETSEEVAEMRSKSEPKPSRTREEIIAMMNRASKRPVTDPDILESARKDGPGSGYLPSDRIEKDIPEGSSSDAADHTQDLPEKPSNYKRVLEEARKLQVTDMRDQAFLEIVDYAIDRSDMGQAADIVAELSTPELRDTARSRMAKGLAQDGDANAAFAVLDEIEIPELAAPIRLEIIAALMETRRERQE